VSDTPSTSAQQDVFASTHWTVVLAAGRRTDTKAQAALEQLCRTYWFPLYAYVRRRGHAKEDAEDLTQEFLRRFLAGDALEGVSSDRGRFRAFLLAALKHFLANERDRSQAQKRGGGAPHLSLDWHTADTQFQVAAKRQLSPDQAYDREWAQALLAKVLDQLRQEHIAEGKGALFDRLQVFLASPRGELPYAEAARDLGMEATAVRVAVHRLRKRYRDLLRGEIVNTLANPAGAEEEVRALFGAFASP
jgi:RNA polymerase sigma-70 factor (ECF subfamily)